LVAENLTGQGNHCVKEALLGAKWNAEIVTVVNAGRGVGVKVRHVICVRMSPGAIKGI